MVEARPILVTGGHRSGTGWVGEMLAATPSPTVAYLWEPFSLRARPGLCAARFPYWFFYLRDQNAEPYRSALQDTLTFRYRPGAELREARTPKDLARLVRDWSRTAGYRRRGARPLMKDPIALFSAEWVADTFQMDTIVLIRHPAAFVNSILGKGWEHPFDHFVRQPLLMRELSGWDDEIRAYAEHARPLLDQAILLWNVIHDRILTYRERRADWAFLRHEDLSREPVAGFRQLYDRLGLTWTDRVLETIEAHSGTGNPAETRDAASHRRDSTAAIAAWKRRLTSDQIARIRARTERVASELYDDDDW